MTGLIKHNPAFFSEDELRDRFVVRHRELETLLRCVRENTGGSNQHVLVIGPRGMGKTMLVRRLAQAVQDEPELGKSWFPLVLPEECYGVATAGELWLQVVKQVAESPDAGRRWQDIYQSLHEEPEDYLRERALARLLEYSDEQRRRLLIVVENLDMLLGEQADENAGWDLRHTLLNEPRLMILATATTRFDEIVNADKPLYDTFRELSLPPLSTGESIRLWETLAGERLSEEQITPLEILTGGSPRMLALLGEFAGGRSFADLKENLVYLIDDHTAYFKANVENLAPLERRIFTTLAEIWKPAGASEIARQARTDVNKCSSLLNRLVSRGAVSEVGRQGRKKLYQVTERLFNIYHLMRHSRSESDRVRVLVTFMALFYGPIDLGRRLSMEAVRADAGKRKALVDSYEQLLRQSGPEQKRRLLDQTPGEFMNLPEQVAEIRAEYHNHQRTKNQRREKIFIQLRFLPSRVGAVLGQGKLEEKNELYREIETLIEDIETPATEGLEDAHRFTLLYQCLVLSALDRRDQAVRILDRALAKYDQPEDQEEIEWYIQALGLKGQYLDQLGRADEARSSFDAIIEPFIDAEQVAIAASVARALAHKGDLLRRTGDLTGALTTFNRMLQAYGSRPEPVFRKHLCLAMYNRGLIFDEGNRWEDSIEAYNEAINRFGTDPEPEIAPGIAWSFVYKGYALGQLGRDGEAVAVLDTALAEIGNRADERLAEPRAAAMQNLGASLGRLNRLQESLEISEKLAMQLADRKEPQLRSFRAGALFTIGSAHLRLGNPEQALAAYEESIEKYRDLPESDLERPICWALNGGAWAIYESMLPGRLPQGLEWSEEAVKRFPGEPLFLHTKACLLGMANRWPEAFETAKSFLEHIELSDSCMAEQWIQEINTLFIDAAASGQAAAALDVLEHSSVAPRVEPLAVALKEMTGREVEAPQEVVEVSESIRQRIEQRKRQIAH